MRLLFLGTGGYHPNERRHTAGLLLPDIGLLLDAGSGTFRAAERLISSDLTIAVSHAHLDHICGLTYLLVPLHQGVIRRLRVLAESEVLEAIQTHLFCPAVFPVLPAIEFDALEENLPVSLAGEARLRHQRLPSHPGGSRGFRIDWRDSTTAESKSLAYITDTTVDGSYTEFIRGVDLLVHECYFPDSAADWAAKTGHSYTSAVAELARDADVGRVLLTHIDPQQPGDDPTGLIAAQRLFPAIELAEDLREYIV
ncbi:MAG: MBL fold metallo-hydrolase [Planctomycetaceae bacterium]